MRISDAPCRICQMRQSGCHQHCESYIDWKKKQKAIKEQTRNELELKDYEIIRSKKIRKWKEEHRQ